MIRVLAAAIVLAVPLVGRASPRAEFAARVGAKPRDVSDVMGYRVVGPRTVSRVVFGRVKTAHGRPAQAVVVHCAAGTCRSRRFYWGKVDSLRPMALVDLAGAPGPLWRGRVVAGGSYTYRELHTRGKRWPALVLRTRYIDMSQPRGKRPPRRMRQRAPVTERVLIVSLRAADWQRALVFNAISLRRGRYGHGHSSGFTLVRGKGKVRDIIESRRRHLGYRSRCRRPKPTKHRHVFDGSRYQQQSSGVGLSSGCH